MPSIYTLYSKSHKPLYDNYFKKTLREIYSKDELLIRSYEIQHDTGTGEFMTEGWKNGVNIKQDVLLLALQQNKDGWFIFSDCDIQFFKPFVLELKEELEGYDVVCQSDTDTLCNGFFACKSNDTMINFIKKIKENFWSFPNDQVAFNYYKNLIKYKTLDKRKYFTVGNFFFNNENNTHEWDGSTNILPPKEIVIHHANFVRGVSDKIKLLDMIRNNYTNMNYDVRF